MAGIVFPIFTAVRRDRGHSIRQSHWQCQMEVYDAWV